MRTTIEGAPTGGGVSHLVHETGPTGKYAASKKVTETMKELQEAGVPAGVPITSEFGVAREMVTGVPTGTGAGGLTWHAEKVYTAVTELDKYAERLRRMLPVLDSLDPAEAAKVRKLLETATARADDMRPFLDAWRNRHVTHPAEWVLKDGKIVPVKPTTKLPNPIPGEPGVPLPKK